MSKKGCHTAEMLPGLYIPPRLNMTSIRPHSFLKFVLSRRHMKNSVKKKKTYNYFHQFLCFKRGKKGVLSTTERRRYHFIPVLHDLTRVPLPTKFSPVTYTYGRIIFLPPLETNPQLKSSQKRLGHVMLSAGIFFVL